MRKLTIQLLAAIAIALSASCKEHIQHEYPVGALVQLNHITIPGVEPPLTIDSIYKRTENVISYYVTDKNGRVLKNLADYQMKPWTSK